ncbi:MAG: DUF692 domain-containing protein [Candidatus Tectomicrobia bacterium]|nr:DUF692 domain-containing protein [Candidatus Tectomicrobia bacterium]
MKRHARPLPQLPAVGVGLGYRPALHREIVSHLREITCLEIIIDHFLDMTPEKEAQFHDLASNVCLLSHGIGMSLGTALPVESAYVNKVKRTLDIARSPWFSEHAAFTKVPGIDLGQLMPLPFTEEAVDAITQNIGKLKNKIKQPLLLENIAYYLAHPAGEMTEAEFLTRILHKANVYLLLDINNAYTNSVNHNYDPYEFILSLPLDRVVQIHLAGGEWKGQYLIDSHRRSISREVWRLFDFVVPRCAVKGVIVERDGHYPPFSELLEEVRTARSTLRKYGIFVRSLRRRVTSVPGRTTNAARPSSY